MSVADPVLVREQTRHHKTALVDGLDRQGNTAAAVGSLEPVGTGLVGGCFADGAKLDSVDIAHQVI